jgi:hypothetical protein
MQKSNGERESPWNIIIIIIIIIIQIYYVCLYVNCAKYFSDDAVEPVLR